MQQNEADIIAINKIDMLSEERLGRLREMVGRNFPKAQVIGVSARSGRGFDELARLLGRLRFAVDGADKSTVEEVGEEITVLARHLPEEFQVANLLAVSRDTSEKSSRLAKLYLDRCFQLSAGKASEAQASEAEIRELQSGE